MVHKKVRDFFLPSVNKKYILRIGLVGLSCYLIFSYLFVPLRIEGRSMEPAYSDGSLSLCWRIKYLYSDIERFDVVTVRFSGRSVMLLKRVIALPGETARFRAGQLYINDKSVDESYVYHSFPWNLPVRRVAENHVYVIGDNRGEDMSLHRFGQVNINRIVGGVIL